MQASSERPWVHLVESPDEGELAGEYGRADLFVLATKTRFKTADACGEGFGIVLVEAALTGLPVIGPASGGGRAALADGFNGRALLDPTIDTLADTIRPLLDPCCRHELGERSRLWATTKFGPENHNRTAKTIGLLLRPDGPGENQ